MYILSLFFSTHDAFRLCFLKTSRRSDIFRAIHYIVICWNIEFFVYREKSIWLHHWLFIEYGWRFSCRWIIAVVSSELKINTLNHDIKFSNSWYAIKMDMKFFSMELYLVEYFRKKLKSRQQIDDKFENTTTTIFIIDWLSIFTIQWCIDFFSRRY